MADFGVGRKLLEKYGWKDGDGLGKPGNEGIAVPIKPKVKCGKEGMGYDIAKDLVDTWWVNAYNESLSRVNVQMRATVEKNKKMDEESLTVSMNTPDEADEGPPSAKIIKRMIKSNFTEFSKGATLANGEMTEEARETKGEDGSGRSSAQKSSKVLTDEALLKACGGRTCHKAARFGNKLSGKLARLAAQDQELMEKIKASKSQTVKVTPS